FQIQSGLGAPTRPSSETLPPTNCRCRKRRLGSTTSVPVARAFRISTSSAKKRQASGVKCRRGWPLLRFCFLRLADGCCYELDHRRKPKLLCWTFATAQGFADRIHLGLVRH